MVSGKLQAEDVEVMEKEMLSEDVPKDSKTATFCCLKCVFPLSGKHFSDTASDLLMALTLEVCRIGERLLLLCLFVLFVFLQTRHAHKF